MLVIHFECNNCDSKDGEVAVLVYEPVVKCRTCGELEVIKDFDIAGHGTEVD